MGIHPFGYIMLLIIAYIVYKSKTVNEMFSNFLIFELFFGVNRLNYGYFMKIGGSELEYNDTLLGILFFLSLYILIKNGHNLKRKLCIYSLALVAVVLVGMLVCYIKPVRVMVVDYNHSWDYFFRGYNGQLNYVLFTQQSVLMFFRLVIFLFILNTTSKIIYEDEWVVIAKTVLKYSKYLMIYGLFEIIMKFIIHIDLGPYLIDIFGRGVSTGGGIDRLQGLCREPSYYALGLFNYIILSICNIIICDNISLQKYIWILIALLIGCISSSFSFLICLISILFFIYNVNKNKLSHNTKLIFFICFVIMISLFIVVYSFDEVQNYLCDSSLVWSQRIGESIKQIKNGVNDTYVLGQDFSSESVRLVGGILTFKAAMTSPVFGLGIGTSYCVMGIFAIISNIGLVGFILWLRTVFFVYPRNNNVHWVLVILLPVFFANDLYTLYDTSYVLLAPIISTMLKINDKNKGVNYD